MALKRERIQEIENHLLAQVASLHPRWLSYVRLMIRKAVKNWAEAGPPELDETKEYDDFTLAARTVIRTALKNAMADAAAQAEVDELVS